MARIMIVDDERGIRVTFKEFLQDEGHKVWDADSAETALQLLEQHELDVIIADVILPKMTGVDLVRNIREKSEDIEIILISGEPTVSTAIEAMRGRVYDYLSKPVSGEELCQVVAHAAKVKTLHDENKRLSQENQRYQKRLEQLIRERTASLKEREKLLQALIDSLPHELWAMDMEQRILLQNTDSRRTWGDAIGKTLEEVEKTDPKQHSLMSKFIHRALQGEVTSLDLQVNDRIVHLMVAPLTSNGHIQGILGRRIDITDRVRRKPIDSL